MEHFQIYLWWEASTDGNVAYWTIFTIYKIILKYWFTLMFAALCWLYTRACKYNLGTLGKLRLVWRGKMCLLGPYLVTMETFVDQRSQSTPPSIVYTRHLRRDLTNRKWMPELKAMCSVATILMNRPINNLLEFIFRDRLNHRFSHHSTPYALLQITNQLLFQVLWIQVIFLHSKHWTSHTVMPSLG